MLVLVFNAGSSSLKCELIDVAANGKSGKILFKSIVDRLGKKECEFRMEAGKKILTLKPKVSTITQAMELSVDMLSSQKIFGKQKIEMIAHRVVHGGEKYNAPIKITPKILKEIESLNALAPLHNPPNLEGIKASQKIFKGLPQVAVFDTGYYSDMIAERFLYPVPIEWYTHFGVRKYGFHGISHEYVVVQALKKMRGLVSFGSQKNVKIISCHLGNGCSITASLGGKALDTSMGFTPLEGIPMGTRSGSIDPALVPYIAKKLKITADEVISMLNKESGLIGVSGGLSSDMRTIHAECVKGTPAALLAYLIFVDRVAKQIAAYTAVLGGLDALVFTAGIGENAVYLHKDIAARLKHLKSYKTYIIPTNEELHIAQLSAKLR